MKFDPAYHLRTNKQVERALFGDLIRSVIPHVGIAPEKYAYIGMGGPFLEDFITMQSILGCKTMTSLEMMPHVVRRQHFNRPHSRIKISNRLVRSWVDGYRPGLHPLVVWLDYSKTDWKDQVGECVDLIPKLPAMSILKVTLICRAVDLGNPAKDPLVKRREALSAMFSGSFTQDDVRSENFHRTIKSIFAQAVSNVLGDAADMTLRPLAIYTYNDGTPILTITCIVGPERELERIIKRARLRSWNFATLDWGDEPIEVNIPDLGIRERLAIDRRLPDASVSKIVKRLKLSLAETPGDSEKILESYVRFARHAPWFVKAAI